MNESDGNGLMEAAESAWIAYDRLSNARTLPEQTAAWVALSDAMSDLVTWVPSYDIKTGGIRES